MEGQQMNFYQNPAPTPFVTVGNTGLHQPQLQQSILREQYTIELENRLRALWDKYDSDLKYYMDRIRQLEEAGDDMSNCTDTYEYCIAIKKWRKVKENTLLN